MVPADAYAPLDGIHAHVEKLEERAFAGAGLAGDEHKLSGLDLKGDVPED